MAVPDYLLCDICGEKLQRNHGIYIVTNSYTDSDGDTRRDGVSWDLCPQHMKCLIAFLLEAPSLSPSPNLKLGREAVIMLDRLKAQNK